MLREISIILEDMKKIHKGLIIGVTVLVILILVIIVMIFNNKKETEDKYYKINKINSEKISEVQIIDDIIYYLEEKGEYKSIDVTNENLETGMSIENLHNISDIKIAPSRNKLIFKDNETNIYNTYNLKSKTKQELDKYIISAIWHPLVDNTVVGSYYNPPYSNINIYGGKEDDREEVLNISLGSALIKDVSSDLKKIIYIVWTYDENEVILFEESIYFNIYDLDKKKAIFHTEEVTDGKFNSDDSKILISKKISEESSKLSILNAETFEEEQINLDININKAEFASDPNILIYAQTKEDDFEGIINDTIWKLNINTGEKTQLTELNPNINYDISNIMVSQDDRKIYFINKYDNKLYQVNIE